MKRDENDTKCQKDRSHAKKINNKNSFLSKRLLF